MCSHRSRASSLEGLQIAGRTNPLLSVPKPEKLAVQASSWPLACPYVACQCVAVAVAAGAKATEASAVALPPPACLGWLCHV